MKLTLKDNLPWTTVSITYQSLRIEIADVLIDTGSASTVFSADAAAQAGINPAPDDRIVVIRGVGGQEVVFVRQLEKIAIGDYQLGDFDVEVGGMDYGFVINGILGMDFLLAAQAQIDLNKLELRFDE
jgi:predicted aspartyl protease